MQASKPAISDKELFNPRTHTHLKIAHMKSIGEAQRAAKKYSEENPHDFGSCGGCMIIIQFGRKRKMKEMFFESGIISESDETSMYGKKGYSFKHFTWQVPGYNQQNANYKESALRAYVKAFRAFTGIELILHTWCD